MLREIRPRELALHLANGHRAYLLDVRQPWEHATAALPDSHLIPLDELAARVGEIPTAAESLLVVYCHHGVRSLSAAALLERLGHRQVLSLAGGIEAWSQTVDPTVPRY